MLKYVDWPTLVIAIVGTVVFTTVLVLGSGEVRRRNAPCVKYQPQHVNETLAGRRCNAFMCESYETVPAHDEQVCVERQP
jgi:hypothetical protein